MKARTLVFVIAATLLFAMAAYSHHSIAGTYDQGREIKVEGKLVLGTRIS